MLNPAEKKHYFPHSTNALFSGQIWAVWFGFQGCLGYDYNPADKTITINEEEAAVVRYIFQRYTEGAGGSVIAKELENLGYKTKRGSPKWADAD